MDMRIITLGITNCYLIKGDQGYILVDAGGLYKLRSFARKLRRLGIDPEEIKLIIITHGHYDHVGSLAGIKSLCKAKVAMTPFENDIVAQGQVVIPAGTNIIGRMVSRIGKIFYFLLKFKKVRAEYLITEDGFSLYDFGVQGKVILTPGHTEGSLSVILEDGRAIVGDLAMNKPMGYIFPLFADEPELIYTSWRKLVDLGVEGVYPAHGEPFSINLIRDKLNIIE